MSRLPLISLALLLAACRSPPDTLVGDWAGALDCAEDDFVYATDVTMSLETPEAGRHPGTLALKTTWTGDDGVDYRQSSVWTVALRQEFPSGAQDVDFVQADCAEALRSSEEELTAEGCEDVGGGIGTSSLAWDGADALAWGGGCTGELTRGGTIAADSGDPDEGAR
jgi:hypothetical protein